MVDQPGGVQTPSPATGKVYPVKYLQIFQGDMERAFAPAPPATPPPGRRVIPRHLHDGGPKPPAPGADGHSQWSSFASDPKGEIMFLSVPVDLSADGPNRVIAKVAGEAKGKQAPQFAKSNINQVRIEVVDAHTIAMLDPKKGRLVYSKE